MKNYWLIALTILIIIAYAAAQSNDTPDLVQRAASAVPTLHDRMNDPDSFVLMAVHTATTKGKECLDKWCKHKEPISVSNVCYTFRSHNAMGGYGDPSVAILVADTDWDMLKKDSGKLLVIGTQEEADHNSGMIMPEWAKDCQSKKYDADITAQVKAAITPKK